jgi:hypothetical protein
VYVFQISFVLVKNWRWRRILTDVNVFTVADVSVVRDWEVEVAVECDRSEVNVGEVEELVSDVPFGLDPSVESNVALVCHREEVTEVHVGVSAVDSGVEGLPVSIWFKHAIQIR